jgi:hypothetical protein
MIRTEGRRPFLVFILNPLCVILLLSGVFGLVYLRSNIITLEYNLSDLEQKKLYCLSERKSLLAEKTSILSFDKVEASLRGNHGFVFPDRVKVIHVKKHRGSLPHKASLERKQLTDP